ncbi:hypothetical protein [Streptomyces sp. LN245]|uniref:hypothetical protein n=1 Tax=Streptomyces sp. LN245 TaxID=3112975 RepID=UPI0037158B83
MPSDFPPWPRVYAFFARWRDTGLVSELHERLREAVRAGVGRSPEPSAGVVDSQSVKRTPPSPTPHAGSTRARGSTGASGICSPTRSAFCWTCWSHRHPRPTGTPPGLFCPRQRRTSGG